MSLYTTDEAIITRQWRLNDDEDEVNDYESSGGIEEEEFSEIVTTTFKNLIKETDSGASITDPVMLTISTRSTTVRLTVLFRQLELVIIWNFQNDCQSKTRNFRPRIIRKMSYNAQLSAIDQKCLSGEFFGCTI